MSESVYLIAGEQYLAEEALDQLREQTQTDPLSEAVFEPRSETAEILGALTTSSLLGGRRMVVIRDAHDLTKDQADAIASYLEQPSPDTVLALIATGKTKVDAAIKKHGSIIGLEAPRGKRLIGWIRERGRSYGLKVDDRGAWGLTDAVGIDLRELDGALEQLSTSLGEKATITAAVVKQAFPRQADERVFAFTDAVGERRLPVAMIALRRLLDQGDEPLMVFGALAAHIKRLLRARRYADSGPRALGDALGMPEWRAEKMMRQVRAYREEELVQALAILSRTDVDMKGEFPSSQAALERAVVQIVGGS